MIDLAFAVQAVLVGQPTPCMVGFDIERRRVANISVECPNLDDQSGAEAEIVRQLTEVGRVRDSRFDADYRWQNRVVVFASEEDGAVQWYATSQPVRRVPPRYPQRAAARGQAGTCAVRYHVVEGEAEVASVACNPNEYESAFGPAARDAVERWRFTNGLPVPCDETSIEFSISPSYEILPAPAYPACSAPPYYVDMYPSGLRDFAAQIADLLAVDDDGKIDAFTGEAACALMVDDERASVQCPDAAPDREQLIDAFNSLLARADIPVDPDDRFSFAERLAAHHDETDGWSIRAFQPVYTREPAVLEAMSRRRAAGLCRAGVTVGRNGRAEFFEMSCVMTINPARYREVFDEMRADAESIVRNTVWLPAGQPTCLELEFRYPHPNPITDRGVPGTQLSELPRYCNNGDDE